MGSGATACANRPSSTAGADRPDSGRTNYLVRAAYHLCGTNNLCSTNHLCSANHVRLSWWQLHRARLLSAVQSMYAAPQSEDSRKHHTDLVNQATFFKLRTFNILITGSSVQLNFYIIL